jgi:hypothetical protein
MADKTARQTVLVLELPRSGYRTQPRPLGLGQVFREIALKGRPNVRFRMSSVYYIRLDRAHAFLAPLQGALRESAYTQA